MGTILYDRARKPATGPGHDGPHGHRLVDPGHFAHVVAPFVPRLSASDVAEHESAAVGRRGGRMSTSTLVCREARSQSLPLRALDYLELTKPKIALLELLTVAVAGCLARWNSLDAWALAHALLGTTLLAAGASALNQWLER